MIKKPAAVRRGRNLFTCSFVQESLPLFGPEVRVLVGQDELDSVEEVGFAGAVATDDDVVTWNKNGRESRQLTPKDYQI